MKLLLVALRRPCYSNNSLVGEELSQGVAGPGWAELSYVGQSKSLNRNDFFLVLVFFCFYIFRIFRSPFLAQRLLAYASNYVTPKAIYTEEELLGERSGESLVTRKQGTLIGRFKNKSKKTTKCACSTRLETRERSKLGFGCGPVQIV